jgi:hypothetical protein
MYAFLHFLSFRRNGVGGLRSRVDGIFYTDPDKILSSEIVGRDASSFLRFCLGFS